MMAVRLSEYEKFGCVNCGCEYCYANGILGQSTPLTCGECNTKFIVIKDALVISSIGFKKETYDGIIIDASLSEVFSDYLPADAHFFDEIPEKDKKGIAIEVDGWVYPLARKHPRSGIAKHKFVKPDIRPENGIGEFCNPRGVGYDLACFVKRKEAGQRITDMINKINEEYDNKGFSCRLDYREYEPNWIQVKITYPNELRAFFLAGLIAENENVITEDIVRKAITMKVDFANYWEYNACGNVYNVVDRGFMHDIIGKPEDFTKEQRDEIYDETWQRNNYLDQFEVWGVYKQIDLELEKGNVENAVALARHLVDLNGDHFNYELMVQRGKERKHITNLRRYLHEELVRTLNIHYKNTGNFKKQTSGKQTCDYEKIKDYANISEAMKVEFISDWEYLVSMIFKIVDLKALKMAIDWEQEKDAKAITQEKQLLNRYPNLYAMFSLFGLYAQVSRNIEEGQLENAVLAIEHVASQANSPLFTQLQKGTSNSDVYSLKMQWIYTKIINMASKYYGEHNKGRNAKRVKNLPHSTN